jgi:16S rRNA (cytosine967-C5)-methyltransferase
VADSDEVRALCAAQWVRGGYELPDWWEYRGLGVDGMRDRERELGGQRRAVRESVPDWLDEVAGGELGDAWDRELTALNGRAAVFLRVNRLKGTREEAVAWLAGHGVEAREVPGVADGLVLGSGKVLPKPLLAEGRVEIQDAGSQLVGPMVDPQAGEVVIDACAGAGGKTLHLAALSGGRAKLVAMDVVPGKLEELKRRADRAGVRGVRTEVIGSGTVAGWSGKADRVLIDAPCSGLGTLRRQPDLKWRLSAERLEELRTLQRRILREYAGMVRVGGRVVYATCSVLPSENRGAAETLSGSGEFALVDERVVSPAATGFYGFYAAVLERRA